ncbi:hypothetical protein AA309_12710 [Microvirga vignae]|uniref:Uncharacterized protein n=1 Tax=Microvirga vignae TaxID=1225564 RepID=A0A0H1RIY5_9HYPH|nr:hypothetical protein AA309_12710 [Microvirga vignae]
MAQRALVGEPRASQPRGDNESQTTLRNFNSASLSSPGDQAPNSLGRTIGAVKKRHGHRKISLARPGKNLQPLNWFVVGRLVVPEAFARIHHQLVGRNGSAMADAVFMHRGPTQHVAVNSIVLVLVHLHNHADAEVGMINRAERAEGGIGEWFGNDTRAHAADAQVIIPMSWALVGTKDLHDHPLVTQLSRRAPSDWPGHAPLASSSRPQVQR